LLFVWNANSLVILFNPGHNVASCQYEPLGWGIAQKILAISLFSNSHYYLVFVPNNTAHYIFIQKIFKPKINVFLKPYLEEVIFEVVGF